MTPSFEQKAPTLIIIFGFKKPSNLQAPSSSVHKTWTESTDVLVFLKEVRIKWFLFEIICNFGCLDPPTTTHIHHPCVHPKKHLFHPSSQLFSVVGSSGEEEDRSALNQVTQLGIGSYFLFRCTNFATSPFGSDMQDMYGYVCVRLWEYMRICVGIFRSGKSSSETILWVRHQMLACIDPSWNLSRSSVNKNMSSKILCIPVVNPPTKKKHSTACESLCQISKPHTWRYVWCSFLTIFGPKFFPPPFHMMKSHTMFASRVSGLEVENLRSVDVCWVENG